jgi:hypothetical protein
MKKIKNIILKNLRKYTDDTYSNYKYFTGLSKYKPTYRDLEYSNKRRRNDRF